MDERDLRGLLDRVKAGRMSRRAFAKRLMWAKWLQRLILTPALQSLLVALASRNDWFWRTAFERTR